MKTLKKETKEERAKRIKEHQLARVRGINNVPYLIGCESSDTHEEVVCKAERFYGRTMICVEHRSFVHDNIQNG